MILYERHKMILKRAAAAAMAIMLSAAFFGMDNSPADTLRTSVIVGDAAEYSSQDEYEKELAAIDREKAELDKKIKAAGDSLDKKKEKLAAVKKKAAASKKKIQKQSAQNADTEDEMCRLDDQMRALKYQVQQSENAMSEGLQAYKERLRVIYVAGSDSYSEVLVNAGSFYDMLMRMELMKRVAAHDNAFMDALVAENEKLKTQQAELDEQIKALKEKTSEYAEEKRQLAQEQAELNALVKQYANEIDGLEDELEGYSDKADALSGKYGKLSAEAAAEKAKTATTTTTAAPKTSKTDKDNPETETETAKTKKTTATLAANSPDEIIDGSNETTTKKKKKTTTTTAAPAEEPVPEVIEDTETETPTTTTTTTTTYEEPQPEPIYDDANDGYSDENNYNFDYNYDYGYDDGGNDENVSYDGGDGGNDSSGNGGESVSGDISTVIEYAKGMVGGSYVWAGEQYGATDCSGLVMLSYAQIGISLPHLASSQAEYGSEVSRDSIQPGDLVFFGYSDYASIYHVAMYIGDGKIVHAESTDTGIVISYLDSMAQYNPVICIKRLV